MNRFSRMCMGFALLTAVAAAPAQASTIALAITGMVATASQQPVQGTAEPIATETTRVKRVGTRLETIVVSAGAVDPAGKRWNDEGSTTAVLPTVSDDAFLDGDVTPAGSRP